MYPSSISCEKSTACSTTGDSTTDCELHPTGHGSYELKIRGQFPPRWLANLTSALAARGISVQRGSASKISPSLWEAMFEISPAGAGGLPTDLDYLALARATKAVDLSAVSIRLDSFTLEHQGDALFVEVKAADSVGFLVTLLKNFAFFSLFPAEVQIDTPGGRVHDRFWLKGVGGIAPSESSRQGLQIELEKMRR